MALQGRGRKGFRIDYDPDSRSYTSIFARWNPFLQKFPYPRADSLDCMLRPLANWNEFAFPEIEKMKKDWTTPQSPYIPGREAYASLWSEHEEIYNRYHPMEYHKKDEVCWALFQSLCQKLQKQNANSPFLLKNAEVSRASKGQRSLNQKQWQVSRKSFHLWNEKTGFAEKLRGCFGNGKLTADEIEERIERRLYAFTEVIAISVA